MALAKRARALRPLPPGHSTAQRLRVDFAQYRETLPPPALVRWLRRWAGWGPAPRPLVERLAAGAILLSALGGGAGITAEGGWQDAYGLARNIVANLAPGDGPAGDRPLATVSPSPAPTTPAPATTTPTPGATPSPTAVPAGADPTSGSGEDGSGRDNSGRGDGTVEPGDDNGGSRPRGVSGDSSGSGD